MALIKFIVKLFCKNFVITLAVAIHFSSYHQKHLRRKKDFDFKGEAAPPSSTQFILLSWQLKSSLNFLYHSCGLYLHRFCFTHFQ